MNEMHTIELEVAGLPEVVDVWRPLFEYQPKNNNMIFDVDLGAGDGDDDCWYDENTHSVISALHFVDTP